MEKKLAKSLLAAGMILSLNQATTFAAESQEPEKIHFQIPRENIEEPETVVNGVVKDITQKILPVSVEARFFAPHLDLNVRTDSIHYNDGSVGLKDDLGFNNDNAPEIIFRYKRATLDYMNIHGTGDRNFGINPLTFGSKNFYGNVHSKSDLNYLKFQVTNPIVSFLGTGVDWSYGLTGMQWKGTVSDSFQSKSKKYGAPIPTLGVGAHVSLLDTLLFNAHISGLPLGEYGHFYDIEAGVRFNPLDLLSISVGYRRIHAKLEHNDDNGEFTLNGPYAGLRLDF